FISTVPISLMPPLHLNAVLCLKTEVRTMSAFRSVNPYNGNTIGQYPAFALESLDATLAGMSQAQQAWQREDCSVRAQCLTKISRLLKRNCEKLAVLATQEMGKPIVAARSEVLKCASVCEYYAGEGPAFLADRHI